MFTSLTFARFAALFGVSRTSSRWILKLQRGAVVVDIFLVTRIVGVVQTHAVTFFVLARCGCVAVSATAG